MSAFYFKIPGDLGVITLLSPDCLRCSCLLLLPMILVLLCEGTKKSILHKMNLSCPSHIFSILLLAFHMSVKKKQVLWSWEDLNSNSLSLLTLESSLNCLRLLL